MAYSLLAHLYPYIKGSQEDIATFSLQYLLMQSKNLNRAFTKRIADNMQIDLQDTLQYACQVTGDSKEKERPDMVGIDSKGIESLIFEMKFYASLTVNQPVNYLKRCKKNGGKGLMFVCPGIRRTNLWSKLKELCNGMDVKVVNEYCVLVDGIKLSIITWTEIIELLKQVASSVDMEFLSDVMQLEGYCNQLDSDAFVPFTDVDLSADVAKKEERYYMVLDEVIDLLMADDSLDTSKKGLKATAYRKGYTRSLIVDECAISLNYDRDLWRNPSSVETPFWVAIRNKEWEQTDDICNKWNHIPDRYKEHFWNIVFLAIDVKQNVTLSELCEDIKQQILGYIALVR